MISAKWRIISQMKKSSFPTSLSKLDSRFLICLSPRMLSSCSSVMIFVCNISVDTFNLIPFCSSLIGPRTASNFKSRIKSMTSVLYPLSLAGNGSSFSRANSFSSDILLFSLLSSSNVAATIALLKILLVGSSKR
ncbi:hypothetical protein ACHAXS_001706 [Conticribra weissflogii]